MYVTAAFFAWQFLEKLFVIFLQKVQNKRKAILHVLKVVLKFIVQIWSV